MPQLGQITMRGGDRGGRLRASEAIVQGDEGGSGGRTSAGGEQRAERQRIEFCLPTPFPKPVKVPDSIL